MFDRSQAVHRLRIFHPLISSIVCCMTLNAAKETTAVPNGVKLSSLMDELKVKFQVILTDQEARTLLNTVTMDGDRFWAMKII